MRRDIHRLFDDGWLAVDPASLKVSVYDELESYPQYAKLHDEQLHLQPQKQQIEWLGKHWSEHRC